MAFIRVFLVLWMVGRTVLKIASALTRGVVTLVVALPGIILPKKVIAITVNVSETPSANLLYSFETAVPHE